jgi:hypothetical protein
VCVTRGQALPALAERSFPCPRVARASQLYQQLGRLGVFPVSGIEATGEVSGSACVAGGGPLVLIYCRVLAHGAVVVQAKSPHPQAAASMCDMLQASL